MTAAVRILVQTAHWRKDTGELVDACRAHAIEAASAPQFRPPTRSIDITAPALGGLALITIAGGIGLGKLCELFFEQAYNSWFRDYLDTHIFRSHRRKQRGLTIELHGVNGSMELKAGTLADLDAGVRLLPDVLRFIPLEGDELFPGERLDDLTYHDGTWFLHTNRSVYAYRPGTRRFEQVPDEET